MKANYIIKHNIKCIYTYIYVLEEKQNQVKQKVNIVLSVVTYKYRKKNHLQILSLNFFSLLGVQLIMTNTNL